MIAYVHAGDACIVAQHQPALALEFARRRELDERAVLAGTGLASLDLPDAACAMTPHAYLRLLANVAATGADASFLLGQQMLPGHYGAASQALSHAGSLREALLLLAQCQPQLSPMLAPRLREEGGIAVLYWTDSFGAGAQRGLLTEMHMAAVTAMCRWLGGARLPWRYCFNRTQPRYVEQHEMHLGGALRFNCHLDAMLIEPAWLDRPWPRANGAASTVALRAIGKSQGARSLLCALYDYLLEHIRCAPTLEHSAAAFGISLATLKRHLARHGTHFQAELDQVRAHVALHLFHTAGYDNEAVARYLGFHDANNFRRSFKRWTGVTPMLLRQSLLNYRSG